MIHQLILLMGAGTEPEQNLIANGLRSLLSDARFAGDLSGGSLPVEDALDEILWTDPPVANYAARFVSADLEFEGGRLPADQPLVIGFAAANTDPAQGTGGRAGNRAHLAWGAGPHACPAKEPGRLIASVAIETLLDRLPDIELAVPVDRLEWRPGPFHRALVSLPVRFPPVRALDGSVPADDPHASAADPETPSLSGIPSPRPHRTGGRAGRLHRLASSLRRRGRGTLDGDRIPRR